MAVTKEDIRKQLLERLRGVSASEIERASTVIAQSVVREIVDLYIKPTAVHIYRPNPEWNEIDTNILIGMVQSTFVNVQIDQPSLSPVATMSEREYDVIIMPCLGFDEFCRRIGRGAGWYDRFLTTQPGALKICVSLDAMRYSEILVEEHDQLPDMVVTEKAVYTG